MDFSNLDRLSLVDSDAPASAELRPIFDPRFRTFSVQLWKDGQPSGIHGLVEAFRYADDLLDGINDFLAAHEFRALTEEDKEVLYAALIRAKGGPDWMILQIAADGQL